jgi:PEP-CTERM motif
MGGTEGSAAAGGGGYFGGGGGGGYSGGGGGGGYNGGGGGGGGSFLAEGFTEPVLTAGVRSGDGYVSVSLVPAPVPEPSTWAMMLAGLTGLGVMALRRSRKTTPA